jgi:hypothetical protein
MSVSVQKLFHQKSGKNLFIHGGVGSGFKGHKGRKGKVGGSSKGDRTLEDILEEQGRLNDEIAQEIKAKPDHRKRVEDIVKRLGFPMDKVKATEDEGYLFNVGNNTYRAAGEYNSATGVVSIFNIDEQSDMTMEGILAHEVMHDKWATYGKGFQAQFIEIQRNIRDESDPSKWLIKGDGSLRNPADKDKFWAWEIHEEFLSGSKWETLKKTDGVSEYSEAYWEDVRSNSPYSMDLAVNETLAEIARIESNLSGTGIDVDDMQSVDPVWKDLYKRVKRGNPVEQNRLFHFSSGVNR